MCVCVCVCAFVCVCVCVCVCFFFFFQLANTFSDLLLCYSLSGQHGGSEADDSCHCCHWNVVHDKEWHNGVQGNTIHWWCAWEIFLFLFLFFYSSPSIQGNTIHLWCMMKIKWFLFSLFQVFNKTPFIGDVHWKSGCCFFHCSKHAVTSWHSLKKYTNVYQWVL